MKKIKDFLKSYNWLYGTSVLVAIYFTYLFSRMWILNIKGVLFIGVIFVIISILLTREYLRKNKEYSIKNNKNRIIIVLEVIAVSVLLLVSGRSFFIYNYKTTEIEIKSANGEDLNPTVIDAVIVNDLAYPRYGEEFNNEYDAYKDVSNGYVEVSENDGSLVVKIKKTHSAKIIFNYTHGDLQVNEPGKESVDIASNEVTTTYLISSNSDKDSYTVLRGLGSFIALSYSLCLLLLYVLNSCNKKNRLIILTSIIVAGIGLFYINDCSLVISPDSYTYIDFDFERLLDLKPSGRTPIYSMIINGIRYVFSNNFLEFTVILQYVLWFVSMLFLFKTVDFLTKNQKLSFITSILYAISPVAVIWNGSILTESIALSGTLVFIYFIVKYIKTDRVLYGNISIILSLILTFLRPTAIIYLLGVLIFIVMKLLFEKFKKCDIKCLITEIICLAFVVFYAVCFHNVFGIYSISDAVVRQDLMVTMREGFYKNSNDEEFIKNIEEAYKNHPDNEWNAMGEVLMKYPLAKTKELTNYCRNKSMKEYISYIINLTKIHAEIRFEGYAFINMNPRTTWIHNALHKSFALMTFLHVYILVLIEIILMIIKWVKSKRVPWIYCGLFFFPLVIVASSFVGTCGEFMRTAVCCVPFAYLILVMVVYDFLIRKEKAK